MGEATINNERVFVLKFLQSRNPEWSHRLFFAKYDPNAMWFDDLRPAFGDAEFFFHQQYEQKKTVGHQGSSGQLDDQAWLQQQGQYSFKHQPKAAAARSM